MNKQNKKLKVLISAYACEPNKGSEPGVGWNWAKLIAEFSETWVLTRLNNKEVIEKELKENPIPSLHFVYVDLPTWFKFWKRGQRGIYLYYYLWQVKAYIYSLKLHCSITFDLVHHITFGSCWMPAFLSLLPVEFIWGPIGGAQRAPLSLMKHFRFRNLLCELFRIVGQRIFWFDPFYWLTIKRSSAILVCNKDTVKFFPRKYLSKIILISQMGTEFIKKSEESFKYKRDDFIVASVGRLVHWKGFDLAIKSFAIFHSKYPNSKFVIVGEGSEHNNLKALVKKYRLRNVVSFVGQQSLRQVMVYLTKAEVFLFPSLHDGNPKVVLEALSAGMPVVCVDLGGPAEMVTEECGIKVRPVTIDQTIKGLADALLKLANNPDLRKKMGEAGRKRIAEYYSWDKKGEFIRKLYESVLNNESTSCP